MLSINCTSYPGSKRGILHVSVLLSCDELLTVEQGTPECLSVVFSVNVVYPSGVDL